MGIPLVPGLLRDHLNELAERDERVDGRGRLEGRPIEVEVNPIERAEGSARVRMGDTIVYAGVKFQIMTPYSDRPDQGGLMTSAEIRPIAGRNWEPGPPSEESIELGRVVDRGIRVVGEIGRAGGCRAAERCRALQGDREVAHVGAVQHLVGEHADLLRAGRGLGARDDDVGGREHFATALEEQRRAERVLPDERAQERQPPQRTRQRPRARPRPQLGERVEPVLVRVGDHALHEVGVVALAHAMHESAGAVVGDAELDGGVEPALDALERGRRYPHRAVRPGRPIARVVAHGGHATRPRWAVLHGRLRG